MSEDAPLLPRTTEDAHGDEHVPQREKYRLKTGENLESQRAHKIIIALVRVETPPRAINRRRPDNEV